MPARSGSSARPPILLGVDVGGSHTAAVLADGNGTILARAEGVGAAMRPGAAEATAAVVAEVAGRAARLAGATLPADRAVVGAAGAGRAAERAELRARLAARGLARHLEVMTDGEIALVAAFGETPGILVSAGTGSIAYARDRRGVLHRAGGHGWQLGDEGSGYWIGRQALAAAARAQDRHPEGRALLAGLLKFLGLEDFAGLIRWAASATPAQVAGLAPCVLDAARDGEPDARRILADAAEALGDLVTSLVTRFPSDVPVAVAVGGALLQPASPLRSALRELLPGRDPRLRWSDAAADGPLGAVRLAAGLR